MDDFERELKVGFLEEAAQHLSDVEQCFLKLEESPEDPGLIENIFRLAHNLKGSSRAVGFAQMAEFTHLFESVLPKIKNRVLKVSPSTVNLLLRCSDHLVAWIAVLESDLDASFESEALVLELNACLNEEPPSEQLSSTTRESLRSADEVETNPPLLPIKPDKLSEKQSIEDESIRVSLSRLEDLVNNVGELVILQTVLQQHRHLLDSPLLDRTISQLSKITKDIQETSMSLRMVPLKQSFQKMQRIVRDTSQVLGKKVEFVIEGEQTEIDKTVVDHLGDPLVHLVRNAVDHGIETEEERILAGKSPLGRLELSARYRGGQIVIEVKDDGKGLNPHLLRQKAIEKGILKPEQKVSDEEALHLIFAPGFSTKADVSEVSGRGVGMDVVKHNIERTLKGEVEVESELGKGSTFRVILPLTLSIIEGMVIQSGAERFVIPLEQVFESVPVTKENLHASTSLGEVLSLRGEQLPLLRLEQVLGQDLRGTTRSQSIALIIRAGEKPFAVLVDDILGQQQVVIKHLGAELKNLQGVSGGAILADGRAALILEMQEFGSLTPMKGVA